MCLIILLVILNFLILHCIHNNASSPYEHGERFEPGGELSRNKSFSLPMSHHFCFTFLSLGMEGICVRKGLPITLCFIYTNYFFRKLCSLRIQLFINLQLCPDPDLSRLPMSRFRQHLKVFRTFFVPNLVLFCIFLWSLT